MRTRTKYGIDSRISEVIASASAAIGVVVVVGCSVHVEMPAVPETHPANPEAAAAPLPEPSPLLDSYRPVASPPDTEEMDHGSHDMSHGESGGEDEEMSHDGHRMDPDASDSDTHRESETSDDEEPER